MKFGDFLKTWYNVELPKAQADILKDYLHKMGVYYEPSDAGPVIHFECLMTKEECEIVNEFLQGMV